ncbi:MAG: hypothetical protein H0T76_22240 [Nannocystis sp.]|nr:ADYC domain-containing protein [Nannocystis sp.]MBA3549202.1 hypothetical protein [Nannocystis sp.]
MQNFTKLFLTSLALTLAACDAGDLGDDLGDDFGDEATEFRPGPYGGISLNTSFLGGMDNGEMDLMGKFHKNMRLIQVCLPYKRSTVCIGAGKDPLWVEAGQIYAQKYGITFSGQDFINSRWFIEVDYDRDGVVDSTVQNVITAAAANATVQTGIPYWDYSWAYDSKTATGLLPKYIKLSDTPTAMCEVDVDTGSVGSVVLENTSIDTSLTTKALVEKVANVMFIACHSGAAGKAPTWGYVLYHQGHTHYTNVLRVIRADYCNTGESFTEPGQKVAVTDVLGISDQYDAGYQTEGMASVTGGWMCLDRPRLADLGDVQKVCPIPACGEKVKLGDPDIDIMTQLP